MSEKKFDVVVIGSGPGGYVAAIRASQLGMSAAVVEADALGGICLNWGCIPTKALLRSAEIGRTIRQGKQYGWSTGEVQMDIAQVVAYSRGVAAKLSKGVELLLKKNRVTVIKGHGTLVGDGHVRVTDDTAPEQILSAPHIIIATGASANVIEGLEPDGKLVLSCRDAMQPAVLPEQLLIVGAGAIGAEFAALYHELGSQVTLVEIQDRILSAEDEEISAVARRLWSQQGIEINTGCQIAGVKRQGDSITVETVDRDGQTVARPFDAVIPAVGVKGNIHGLGLENLGVSTSGSGIVVNEWMETSVPGVYAIGDVAGKPWLAHKASHEAVTCVEKLCGLDSAQAINSRVIPACTYTHPQIASVGLTEKEAESTHANIGVGRFPFAASGKALATGESAGLVKSVINRDNGEILGVHMIGAEVTELVGAVALAMTLECTEEYLLKTIFPHPTRSEALWESMLDATGNALHI